jgi:aryl-alcohol dehydrogenase-like predicted oxidoreductase
VVNTAECLGSDYIDLFQLHGFDAATPQEEVLGCLMISCAPENPLHRLLEFLRLDLMKALATSEKYGLARHVAHQAYYSLVGRSYEWELMPLGLDQGVSAVVWSPVGWGRLTGKIRRGTGLPKESRLHVTAENGPPVPEDYLYRVVDAIDEVARETGKNVPQIAINWLLQRPTVANVIIGARNEEQLKQNLGSVGWKLTPAQIAKLDAASATTRLIRTGTRPVSPRNPPPV